jgi:Rha family phage regulatory protein
MSDSISVFSNDYGVTERNSIPVVSSRKVAEVFEKRHDVVLRAIDNCECSDGFRNRNFVVSSYREGRGKYREYLLTKDGFVFTVMGFTGKKAAMFKEAYINRFNEMEAFIKNLYEAKGDFPEFTEAIMLTHPEPKHYHFSNELDMINRIVLGLSSKQFKETNNLGKVASIRPYLATKQIESIRNLQRVDIGLIVAVPEFQERKQLLTNYHQRRLLRVIA